MSEPESSIKPDWRWATPEGSREFDRLLDRTLTFREKLEWLEQAETLSLRLQAAKRQNALNETPAKQGIPEAER